MARSRWLGRRRAVPPATGNGQELAAQRELARARQRLRETEQQQQRVDEVTSRVDSLAADLEHALKRRPPRRRPA